MLFVLELKRLLVRLRVAYDPPRRCGGLLVVALVAAPFLLDCPPRLGRPPALAVRAALLDNCPLLHCPSPFLVDNCPFSRWDCAAQLLDEAVVDVEERCCSVLPIVCVCWGC